MEGVQASAVTILICEKNFITGHQTVHFNATDFSTTK